LRVCMCVCLCKREREREIQRERGEEGGEEREREGEKERAREGERGREGERARAESHIFLSACRTFFMAAMRALLAGVTGSCSVRSRRRMNLFRVYYSLFIRVKS